MKKSHIFAGVSALLLTSAAIYAAPDALKTKADIDADGNGAISKTEAMAAADSHFAKMDANGDGTLNQTDRAEMIKKHFAEMDADKNGSINEAEFVASHQARADKHGDKMGGDRMGRDKHDGAHRMGGGGKGGMHMMKMADANNDQAVSKAEFRAAAEARFAKADTNKDGSISAAEHKAQRETMRGPQPTKAAVPDAG
ncbi:MAG: EF-hand domain-containing protein [Sphingorhabdus sp.]